MRLRLLLYFFFNFIWLAPRADILHWYVANSAHSLRMTTEGQVKSYKNNKTLKTPQCHCPTRFDTFRVIIWGISF
jgi:hypothetical protein